MDSRKQSINEIEKIEKEKIIKETFKREVIENLLKTPNIQIELEKLQDEINTQKLKYHSLEIEENTINPKLEKVALIEEKLQEISKREKELEENNQAIEITKEILEIAYQKMKQNVTPKLTEELSYNIQKISNGKYTKINLHEEEGLIIEKENGEYIEAEKLSIRNNRPIIFILTFSNGKRTMQRINANNIR